MLSYYFPRLINACILLLLFSLVAGCATTKDSMQVPTTTKKDSDTLEVRDYSMFNDQGDHLIELVNAGLYRQAAKLYDKYRDTYFNKEGMLSKLKFSGESNKDKYSEELSEIATYINKYYLAKINEIHSKIKSYTVWPLPQTNWSSIATDLAQYEDVASKYDSYLLLRETQYRSPIIDELNLSKRELDNNLQLYAKDSFREYDVFNGNNFFSKYPVSIDSESDVMGENIEQILTKLQSANSSQVEAFHETYGSYIGDQNRKLVSSSFVDALMREKSQGKKTIGFQVLLDVIKIARDKGFILEGVSGLKVAFVEATSRTLLGEGQIEFPSKVDIDLPFEHKALELRTALSETNDSNYVIIFDVAVANVKRRVQEREKIASAFLYGYRDVPNPNFKRAQIQIREAERGLQSAQSTYCGSGTWGAVFCEAAKGVSMGKWRKNLSAANQSYINTSEYIKEPINKKYEFSVSNIEVRKTMSVNYYIIDRVNKRYFKSVFDVSENNSFRIAYNVKDEDINRSSHMSTYNSEQDAKNFAEAPVTVKLSALLEHYIENIDTMKQMPSEGKLRAEMLRDKNTALARYKKQKFDAKPLNDARFDSVVVVYNPTGALGTGFYVKPNLILTNYHVIEGSNFAEMKLYNGGETFGKIVKSDVRLDLALIKVEARGKPVEFYSSNAIDLGSTVEAIGHPSGLTFSITRGVVSAIRKRKSVYDTGGKEILFVQTDTAINPGNSGGPLFLKNRVVGVNNQKIVASSVEGLGFAIHFSEVQKFLKDDF